MNRQTVLIAIAICAILVGLVALLTWQRGDSEEAAVEIAGTEPTAPDVDVATEELLEAELYFPGPGGVLRVERHDVPMPANVEPTERISIVVQALLGGPRGTGSLAPLPGDVRVRKVYLAEEGLVFLDFESPEGSPPPASGSLREMLTVYSLVNTVLLNFSELDRIILLWNGRQLKTFAGHVDTMRPLVANTGLIGAVP